MTQRTFEQTEQTLHRTFETLQISSWDICCDLVFSCWALFKDCKGPDFQSALPYTGKCIWNLLLTSCL